MSEPSTARSPIAQDPDDPWVGATIDDKFRLEALIGEGAMGRVYRGEQLSLGKAVAIKVLHKHLGGDPRIAKRFHREARAASRLSHANSVSIIDFGEARNGTLFIAMELLEGEDLQTIIDHDAPLSPKRIGDLMVQTLHALDEAHHANIIHRDLKPENVVVLTQRQGRERVKVCDFGIAKITESEGRSTAITKDGYVCGTPEYMAPEQAKGEPIDVRVDIYAAGVMLYQMLCGRVPFKAETALGLITKHIMEPPPRPRRVQPTWGIPRSLEAIAMRALEKSPDARWPDARSMAEAVREAVAALGERAEERLGHGSFATDAEIDPGDDEAEPNENAPSTAESIAMVVPARGGAGWLVALGLAMVVLALGIGLWTQGLSPDPVDSTPAPVPTATDPRPPEPEPATLAPSPTDPDPSATDPGPNDEPGAADPGGADPGAADPPPSTPRTASAGRPGRRAPREEAPDGPEAADPPPAAPPGRVAYDAGRAHMLAGDLPAAIQSFREAARLMPSNAQVHKQLGRAQMRTGDVAAGIAAYRRYLELAPEAADRAIIERIIAQQGG